MKEYTVSGLKVTEDGKVAVEDLVDWIASRDAGCAEYLLDALRDWQSDPRDIPE